MDPRSFTRLSLLAWFFASLLVAGIFPLTDDEALYYVYGLNLDWGFHDHPPMVALFTSLGNLFRTELAVRIGAVLSSTTALWIGSVIVRERNGSLTAFHLGWWMIPLLHLYGIIITPDVPLLFFTMLLWLVVHRWQQSDNDRMSLWLIPILAALMYSKYHAAILIFLSLLLWRRFWRPLPPVSSLLAFGLFLPHLWWQYTHDFDTFRYHFVDRGGVFEWENLLAFAGAQVVLFHPYLWVLLFRRAKARDGWQLLHMRVIIGLLVFFTLMTFRGRAEAHWAAAASFSLLFVISEIPDLNIRRLRQWAIPTIVILLLIRTPLLVDSPLNLHAYQERALMNDLHKEAGRAPVCFMNSYQRPSLYRFHTGEAAHSINNMWGGLSQYQLWHYDTALVNRPFLWMASYNKSKFDTLTLAGKQRRVKWIDRYQPLAKTWLIFDEERLSLAPGTQQLHFTIENRSLAAIDYDALEALDVTFFFNHKYPGEIIADVKRIDWPSALEAGASARATVEIELPDTTGSFWFKVGCSQQGWPHTINSHRHWAEITANTE